MPKQRARIAARPKQRFIQSPVVHRKPRPRGSLLSRAESFSRAPPKSSSWGMRATPSRPSTPTGHVPRAEPIRLGRKRLPPMAQRRCRHAIVVFPGDGVDPFDHRQHRSTTATRLGDYSHVSSLSAANPASRRPPGAITASVPRGERSDAAHQRRHTPRRRGSKRCPWPLRPRSSHAGASHAQEHMTAFGGERTRHGVAGVGVLEHRARAAVPEISGIAPPTMGTARRSRPGRGVLPVRSKS